MDKVAAEDVLAEVLSRGIQRWRLRDCSICGEPLHYEFHGAHVFYQSGCGCSWSPPEPRSHQRVADTFNMQTPEVRARMWDEFLACGTSPAGAAAS